MRRVEREMCVECERREVCVKRMEFAKRVNCAKRADREARYKKDLTRDLLFGSLNMTAMT